MLPNVRHELTYWGEQLEEERLRDWLSAYPLPDAPADPKKVGVVLAGDTPLQGFHDLLCVLISGHSLHAKLQEEDILTRLLANKLLELEPRFANQLHFSEMLKGMDAYIASSSKTNAALYAHYFSKKPHLLRKSQSSCALLSGKESPEQLKRLGRDMLQHWGLGSRSVKKLYVPEGYAFTPFFEALESWADVQHHHKWVNNYDYHKSIYLVNGEPHLDNGFLLLRESAEIASPVSVVFYEYYSSLPELEALLARQQGRLQCIVGSDDLPANTPFGQAHRPSLGAYADGLDTLQFLLTL
ncbi:hypothetical protein [Cesiribacter andamanensis]|uniref:Uncharacterized protein n=1 Tax=Cesiribacter andamanensis AMV16 TaxID=1279009 RepID=M7N8R4_9BACT|nr:hypothetical protein [Cesiribacter andamanensis]EMR03652.1 hypothetical protein ADICEAN_01173 [Cesiribacter andamanensis AMV16]